MSCDDILEHLWTENQDHIDSMCVTTPSKYLKFLEIYDPFVTSPKKRGTCHIQDVLLIWRHATTSGAMHYYSILHWPNDGAKWMILDSLDRGANDGFPRITMKWIARMKWIWSDHCIMIIHNVSCCIIILYQLMTDVFPCVSETFYFWVGNEQRKRQSDLKRYVFWPMASGDESPRNRLLKTDDVISLHDQKLGKRLWLCPIQTLKLGRLWLWRFLDLFLLWLFPEFFVRHLFLRQSAQDNSELLILFDLKFQYFLMTKMNMLAPLGDVRI